MSLHEMSANTVPHDDRVLRKRKHADIDDVREKHDLPTTETPTVTKRKPMESKDTNARKAPRRSKAGHVVPDGSAASTKEAPVVIDLTAEADINAPVSPEVKKTVRRSRKAVGIVVQEEKRLKRYECSDLVVS